MSYRFIYDPIAKIEYIDATSWYAERSRVAARNFVEEVTETILVICNDPLRYRNTYKNYRETSLKKFPYSIIYFIDENDKVVVIQSVFHQKRNAEKNIEENNAKVFSFPDRQYHANRFWAAAIHNANECREPRKQF
jgi:plasmid stabilization system protein ParE